eukprot:2252942-Rhodomonas_salina.2
MNAANKGSGFRVCGVIMGVQDKEMPRKTPTFVFAFGHLGLWQQVFLGSRKVERLGRLAARPRPLERRSELIRAQQPRQRILDWHGIGPERLRLEGSRDGRIRPNLDAKRVRLRDHCLHRQPWARRTRPASRAACSSCVLRSLGPFQRGLFNEPDFVLARGPDADAQRTRLNLAGRNGTDILPVSVELDFLDTPLAMSVTGSVSNGAGPRHHGIHVDEHANMLAGLDVRRALSAVAIHEARVPAASRFEVPVIGPAPALHTTPISVEHLTCLALPSGS